MMRTISTAAPEIKALLDMLDEHNEAIAIEVNGQVRGVLSSPETYERLRNAQHELDWQTIQRVQERNADKDPDEIMRDVTQAVEEVRQERYERQLAERRDNSKE